MCAVGGLLGGALGRMFGGSPQFLLSSIGQIDVNIFLVRAWCPQLTTNIVKFYFSIDAPVIFKNKSIVSRRGRVIRHQLEQPLKLNALTCYLNTLKLILNLNT